MFKPYVCVACEKVIYAQPAGVASLISLFNKIAINAPPQAPPIPRDAVAPKEWAVFSIWDFEPNDFKQDNFVCTQIFYPDQTQFGEVSRGKMNAEPGKARVQIAVQLQAFPIGQVGAYTVRTWIEDNDQKIIFEPIEFKIELEINRLQ